MPGPPPKPAAQRRRRNAPAAAATIPATGRAGKAPTLPGSKAMLRSTKSWWRTVWASPMAAQWSAADVPNVVRLAQLHDLTARQFQIVAEGPMPVVKDRVQQLHDRAGDVLEIRVTFESPVQAQLLSEMRQLEDRLGLSPMARRRLQWEIGEADDASAAAAVPDELDARRQRFTRAAGAS